eukprot:TRINITY_DN32253_c0_g1_i1.p1 TRINITY_DN32253_c0_g1~~TRINITY_DN32253_c0_g1_i1.p1  ORF type:complete len:106 (+),score=9.15 TRINITY_DN32253_c0_g1_i1:24-341(+)
MGRKKKSISRKFYWLEHPDQSGHFQLWDPNVPHIVMVGHTICMPTPATNRSRTKVGLHQLGSRPKRHYTTCLFADLSSEILELQGPPYCLRKCCDFSNSWAYWVP